MKVTTDCQTTAPVFQGSPPLSFLYRPLFWGVANNRPLKSNFLNAKLYTKVTPIFPQGISCNEYHVFHKMNKSENKHILQVTTPICFLVEVDRPPFLPSNELTAPIFWHSPLPLRAAVWQWVAIRYLSAPPPPPRGRGRRDTYRVYLCRFHQVRKVRKVPIYDYTS